METLRRKLEAAAVAGMRVDGLDDRAIDRVIQVFHPEVEFREDPKFPDGSVYHGRDALRAYFKQFSSEFDRFWWEAEDLLDADDDQVLLLIRCAVAGKAAARSSTYEGDGFSRWAREGLSEWMRIWTGGKPSKPPGFGSRRCRRRTWRSCGASTARG